MYQGAALRPTATAEELVEVVGRDALKALCERFGGTRIYVPKVAARGHPLAVLMGVRALERLAESYGGTRVELPKTHHRRQLAMEMLQAGDLGVRDIALATDYTERQVWRFAAELRDAVDDGQMTLFD